MGMIICPADATATPLSCASLKSTKFTILMLAYKDYYLDKRLLNCYCCCCELTVEWICMSRWWFVAPCLRGFLQNRSSNLSKQCKTLGEVVFTDIEMTDYTQVWSVNSSYYYCYYYYYYYI